MARYLLKPFGKRSEVVLLGFILITGLFSMFISNTATAAMMLTFLAPVFKALPADGKGRVALTMAIPLGANIGGIGTPIGTPPNMIALKYLNDPEGINCSTYKPYDGQVRCYAAIRYQIAVSNLWYGFPHPCRSCHLSGLGLRTSAHGDAVRIAAVHAVLTISTRLWLQIQSE